MANTCDRDLTPNSRRHFAKHVWNLEGRSTDQLQS